LLNEPTRLAQPGSHVIKCRLRGIAKLTRVALADATGVNGVLCALDKGDRLVAAAASDVDLLRTKILVVARHAHSQQGLGDARHVLDGHHVARFPHDLRQCEGVVRVIGRCRDGEGGQQPFDGCLDRAFQEVVRNVKATASHVHRRHDLGHGAILCEQRPGLLGVGV
jgi:hypothetical protein